MPEPSLPPSPSPIGSASGATIAAPVGQAPADPASRPEHAATLAAGLWLVATPIGNASDLSERAVTTLRAASLVLCEDTRVTGRLFSLHAIATRTEQLHDHNEDARIPALLARLAGGAAIALVSDAGTPLLSDPGYRLTRAAIAAGHAVHAVPGANAAVMALTLSGLPPHPYLFLGFAPARGAARRAHYAALRAAERAGLSATLIWHEAPHRLADTLADLAALFGPRPAAICRELTKTYEEVRRDTLPPLAAHYAEHAPRGEITVLVGPAPDEPAGPDQLDEALTTALATLSLKDAAAEVAIRTGLPRKTVYARALELANRTG